MDRNWLTLLMGMALAGCVQTTYIGAEQAVMETQFDSTAAARERVALGLAYLRRGDVTQAKFNLDRALKLEPDYDEGYLALAYYFEAVSEEKLAEQAYKRSLALNADSADAANNFGVFLCRQARYEEADKWLLQAVENPQYINQAKSYENLGVCAQSAGWQEKAKSYFEQALNYDPRRSVSLLGAAELAFTAKRTDQAYQYLGRYHGFGFESPQSLLLGVELALEQDDTDAAQRYGVTLLAKYPKSEQANTYRTKFY